MNENELSQVEPSLTELISLNFPEQQPIITPKPLFSSNKLASWENSNSILFFIFIIFFHIKKVEN